MDDNHPRKQPNWIVGKTGWWQATSHEVKEYFGLRKEDAWPDTGMPKRVIQGFICWVDPLPAFEVNKRGQVYRPFKIRAKMFCGICGDEVPIGRCQQHSAKHEEESRKDEAQSRTHRYDSTPASEE